MIQTDPLEVDERVPVEIERALHLGPGGRELALDEERSGERGPRSLAGRIETHAPLGIGDGVLDGRFEGRDLEGVVCGEEAGELHPCQAALGLRSHDTLQGEDRGREVAGSRLKRNW